MITCGIDIGSRTIKLVFFDNSQDKLLDCLIADTGCCPAEKTEKLFDGLLAKNKLKREDLSKVTATGYGRHLVSFASRKITEITCHAKGIFYLNNKVRTIIDIGGQDSKIICLDNQGQVEDFVMNDRCAAGTGRFLEVVAEIFKMPQEELGNAALTEETVCPITSTCVVFAETEIVSLIAKGKSKEEIISGVHQSIASRVKTLGGQLGWQEEIAFTGGVAKNKGLLKKLTEVIGKGIYVPPEPQITAALGGAVL